MTNNPKVSLKAQKNKLVEDNYQLKFLNNGIFGEGKLPTFKQKLESLEQFPVKVNPIEIFQINVGYMCNQVCAHCHVDAGPDRKEIMTRETMRDCLDAIQKSGAHTVDLTGGAPEMNPDFRWFVKEMKNVGVKDIIVRSNLTIIVANKKYNDLPEFFKENNVHVISSLPCYTAGNVDKQRGDGVFNASIEALKMLNKVGYGVEGSGLKLDLVFNPGGPSLPGDQKSLEVDYKRELKENFDIVFNELFTITNLPISRFLDFLIASGRYEEYMNKLIESFNPQTLDGIMCKNTISVNWKGDIFDCDFNQILNLANASSVKNIKDFDVDQLSKREVVISQHCYGCTAGAGSSCQGALD